VLQANNGDLFKAEMVGREKAGVAGLDGGIVLSD
jgi:hypothetical protein